MKVAAILLAAALAAPGVLAQAPMPRPDEARSVAPGGAVLRGLDKVAGRAQDIALGPGESANFGRLTITLTECRYPAANPAADAFAHLVIRDERIDDPVFNGWMIASSPALNALDHPRFDVWLIRCTSS